MNDTESTIAWYYLMYITSTVPLTFEKPVAKLTVINVDTEKTLKDLMAKINTH